MNNNNFCHMPWHGIAIAANGNVKPCCQYSHGVDQVGSNTDIAAAYNNDHMKRIRSQFLQGISPSGCNSCWQREQQIGTSRRIWFDEKFGQYIPTGYEYTENVTDPVWIQADINFSNVCNLKCRMCGSWASNQWFDEELRLANIDTKFMKNKNPVPLVQHDLAQLQSMLPHIQHMRRIDFKGGEPMLAKYHNQFLDWLIDKGYNKSITLQYTTNGTVINPDILSRLSKFENVRIMFSVEGTGSLYQYIRGGAHSLDEVVDNIFKYDQLDNVLIGFNVTIQAYNILNLRELHKFLNSLPLKHGSAIGAFTTICNNPDYLSPFVLPDDLRDLAVARLDGIAELSHLSDQLQNRVWDSTKWQTFIEYTQHLDTWRNECIVDHAAEFTKFF